MNKDFSSMCFHVATDVKHEFLRGTENAFKEFCIALQWVKHEVAAAPPAIQPPSNAPERQWKQARVTQAAETSLQDGPGPDLAVAASGK